METADQRFRIRIVKCHPHPPLKGSNPMRKSSASALVATAAAASAFAIATPAFAATWTVTSGGTISGTLKSGTNAVLKDTTTNQSITCTVASAGGSVPNGTGLSGTGIGSITSATFGTSSTKCSGPF